jgi:hypothetical protein
MFCIVIELMNMKKLFEDSTMIKECLLVAGDSLFN